MPGTVLHLEQIPHHVRAFDPGDVLVAETMALGVRQLALLCQLPEALASGAAVKLERSSA